MPTPVARANETMYGADYHPVPRNTWRRWTNRPGYRRMFVRLRAQPTETIAHGCPLKAVNEPESRTSQFPDVERKDPFSGRKTQPDLGAAHGHTPDSQLSGKTRPTPKRYRQSL